MRCPRCSAPAVLVGVLWRCTTDGANPSQIPSRVEHFDHIGTRHGLDQYPDPVARGPLCGNVVR